MSMERFIENYQNEKFDVIVIGGGITGASVAYEAATRGLKVALLEKKDFSWATSAVTSKMIHGGLRYLVNGEIGLVRESLRERRVLENIAPNFVYPWPMMMTHRLAHAWAYSGAWRSLRPLHGRSQGYTVRSVSTPESVATVSWRTRIGSVRAGMKSTT